MWDLTEPELKNNEALCDIFAKALKKSKPNHALLKPFKVGYISDSYVVLKL